MAINMNNWFFIYGPVRGGKTSKLIDFIHYCGRENIVVINHASDTRYGTNAVISHSRKKISARPMTDSELIQFAPGAVADCIFIDEIQFFSPDVIPALKKFRGRIYFSGLDIDFRGDYFPISKKLLQLVPTGNLARCLGICCCGSLAEFSAYIGKVSLETNILVSADDFAPRCKLCFAN